MSAEIIQFVPRANYGRSPLMDVLPALKVDQESRYYELVCDKPFGSYRGSHHGVPFFEVGKLPDGDCA